MYDRPQRDADCSSKGDWKGMENVSVQDIVLATGGVLLSGDDGVMLNKIRLDSRQVETGDLFVPIIGEKVDAHKFLEQVAEKGAGAVLTSEHKEKTEEMAETSCAWIAVDDTKKALQAVGRYLRKRLTPSYCFLLGAVLLFAFSGIWHPLLHHVCVSHEKQELPAIHHASPHTSCAICHGMLQSDETPLFSLSLPHGKPIRNIVFSIRQCRLPVPGEHSPRAPPVF